MRVADRSVLRLIRMWLQSPVAEPGGSKGGSGQWSRSRKGTPQGGVISPLLANLYLHWFDWKFHRPSGPAQWAGAKLVRYADDFVVLVRYQGARLVGFVEFAVGDLVRAGDQSGQDPCGELEGEGSQPGLSGLHVPLRRRSARSPMALSERESVEEGPAEGAADAA